MLINVSPAEVRLSSFHTHEEKIVNYPPQADAREDPSRIAAGLKKIAFSTFGGFKTHLRAGLLAMTFSPSSLTFAAIYEISQRNSSTQDICHY